MIERLNGPTPETFKRFFINRLPTILVSTVYLLFAIPLIDWTLSLVGVYNKAYAGPVEMVFVGFGISTLALVYDRLLLVYWQPKNPYKFSQVMIYFLKFPSDFVLNTNSLPEHWRVISVEGNWVKLGLQTPIKKGNQTFSDGDASQGLDLHVSFVKPALLDDAWVVTVDHHFEGKPLWVLPRRFAVAIFTPTVLHQVEKFFIERSWTEYLVNEAGQEIDFNWNPKI
jgi:hypothetical protein